MRITWLLLAGLSISLAGAQSLSPNLKLKFDNVRYEKDNEVPSYMHFKDGEQIAKNEGLNWIKSELLSDSDLGFIYLSQISDKLGHIHYRYQQTYQGIPIEGSYMVMHTNANMVYAINGDYFSNKHFYKGAVQAEKMALLSALLEYPAKKYKWELPDEEKRLKIETGDPNASYYPKGELVYVARNGDFSKKDFRLAYKFDIYAHQPVERAYVYIDAENGDFLFMNKRIACADTPGTANTAYSGTQNIISDSFGGGYRLQEAGRGNGIYTLDMQNGTNYGNAIDITNGTANWNLTGNDQYGLDAHYGAEMTYDYFSLVHNRNSIDGNGFALYSYVHYDNAYANAFWDGQRMTYGDGGGGITALTSLDIAGHEISHGLTTFTAGLVYQDESGALNESFSDIFGTAVEFYALGYANGDWTVGEDIGSVIRSMSNPGAYGDPDTYFGNNWAPLGGGDNGGVHTNSGVQNYWFYLLTEGGSGTNDAGDVYSVNGLGISDAEAIAFRNLTVYLGPNSEYADARFYAIQSATDLYGPCSPEVIETTNAWYAVNVGEEYNPVFETDFSASLTGGCVSPFNVDFLAESASSGTGTYTWDFGDGNTATGISPSHTYAANGTYTVTLIEDGGPCGIDTAIYVDLISAGQLNNPIAEDQASCTPTSFDLSASGTGQISWWDAPNGGNNLATGNNYTTPNLSTTTSYWVESNTGVVPDSVGPKDNSFGNGGYFTGNQSLIFDAIQPFTLVSVWVDANGAGNRTIELRDDNGSLVQSAVVNIPDGPGRITLNFNVPAGSDFTLGSPSPDLYRNSDGAAYPYTLSNVCSITNSTAGAAGYYYFFYDWEIQTTPCSSPRVEVIAAISEDPIGTDDQICGTGSASLTATGSGVGDLIWFDDMAGSNQVGTGSPFNTPVISSNTTYYVAEELPGELDYVGPIDNTFGGGGFFTGDQALIFDVAQAVTLESVLVYANGDGNRTIELRNSGGTVLQDTNIFIADGQQRVYLNFDLTPGTGFELGTLNGSSPNLYRNNTGPSYPYDLPGQVTIQNSTAGTDYYYFFYDWEIRGPSCFTNLIAVDAIVGSQADATITDPGAFCPTDAAINLTSASTGGTWTGTGITDGNAGTFDPAVAGNGQHEVIYTISGSCADADTIMISVNSALDATINPQADLCDQDGAVTLSAADGGGVWSGTGITNGSAGTFDPSIAGPGTHTITYTISGSCGDTDTETITVNAQQDATINPQTDLCTSGSPINLSAANSGGTWSGTGITDANLGTFDPAVSGSGTFTITYTFTGACGDTDTETITVIDQADATINPEGPVCENGLNINFTAADAGGTWSGTGITNASNGLFSPSTAGVGTHTITYTISGNCGDTQTTDITVEAAPDATITGPTQVCLEDQTYTLSAAGSGTWSGNGMSDSIFNPMTAGLGTHTITYTLTDGNCTDSDSHVIEVVSCDGLGEETLSFGIYPNPNKGQFIIEAQQVQAEETAISIYDTAGKLIYSGNILTGVTSYIVNLGDVSTGVYMMSIANENISESYRLIIE
jgi:Zn-dependent metalloprotease